MTPEQRLAAGRAVSARMAELGRNAAWVQRNAPVDNKTLQSLLEGARWPTHATRGRIEIARGLSPRAVADRLGHRDPSETLKTYAHLWPSDQARILQAIEDEHGP